MIYYNEFDPQTAAWLRVLIAEGHIAPGVVDERSIEDVRPSDLRGFTQCHFFAGIGVWSYALRRAGWRDDRPIWTGSCPCQPFSAAGKGAGFDDERHLWPHFQWLIQECKPSAILGEQVASAAVDNWIDLVHADLEALGYAFGSVPFPSAGVGAPHIRDRNYWVAHPGSTGLEKRIGVAGIPGGATGRKQRKAALGASVCGSVGLADDNLNGRQQGREIRPVREEYDAEHGGAVSRMADANGRNHGAERQQCGGEQRQQQEDCRGGFLASGGMVNAQGGGCERQPIRTGSGRSSVGDAEGGNFSWLADAELQQRSDRQPGIRDEYAAPGRQQSTAAAAGLRGDLRPGPTNGFWRDADWLACRDGRWRPVEPGTFPLAHGAAARVVPSSDSCIPLNAASGEARVMRLRGYGNAINAEAAKAWIETVMECLP